MKNNSSFINELQSFTPNTQDNSIDPKEVEDVESSFNNMLDDYVSYGFESDKLYSRAFIDRVIELAKNSRGHSVPAAIFNLKEKCADSRQVLFYTYDITEIPYLCSFYDFVSKDDAVAYKKELLQLKQSKSKNNYLNETLMSAIERALKDVEEQIKGFDDLSK